MHKNFLYFAAEPYGTSTYSCGQFQAGCPTATDGSTNTGGTTTSTGPLAPLTGFLREQPPSILIPVILVAAVALALLVTLLTKLVRSLKRR